MVQVLTPDREVVVGLLRGHGQAVSDQDAFTFERIGEGRGFCSLLYRVTVGDRSFAVKITNPSGSITGAEGTAGLHENAHNRECDFYQWASDVEGEHAKDLVKIARTFGHQKCTGAEGLIIMDDFSGRMTGDVDYTKGCSVDVVKSILQSVAGYQATYLGASTKFPQTDKTVLYDGLRGMTKMCVDGFPKKEWMTEERRNALHGIDFISVQEDYPDAVNSLPLTLVHCDLWPNNMLFEKTPDHPDGTLMAIVDWQCANVGNALLDVASAIGVCLNPDDRRKLEKDLVAYYVDEMKKRGVDIDLDTAFNQYRRSLKWAALQLVYTTVFNPTADLPKNGSEDGPLSTRLQAILDDIGL